MGLLQIYKYILLSSFTHGFYETQSEKVVCYVRFQQCTTRYVIVDLSNVELIDSFVAAHFSSILKTLHLIGVEAIVCGINPLTAQTMVTGGVELPTNKVTRDLKSALIEYYKIMNMELTPLN